MFLLILDSALDNNFSRENCPLLCVKSNIIQMLISSVGLAELRR